MSDTILKLEYEEFDGDKSMDDLGDIVPTFTIKTIPVSVPQEVTVHTPCPGVVSVRVGGTGDNDGKYVLAMTHAAARKVRDTLGKILEDGP